MTRKGEKTFKLQFLFYALVFIHFLFCNFLKGKNLKGKKFQKMNIWVFKPK